LRNRFDFILIDAQAGVAEMAQVAMSRKVADEVVVVSEYDPVSAAGVDRLRVQLGEDLIRERTWILLNKIPPGTKSFAGFVEAARYLSPIPWHAEIANVCAGGRLGMGTEAADGHTLPVLRTLKSLCGERIGKHVETWVQSRVAVVREPLEEQYADAEKERELLLSHKSQLTRRARLTRWFGLLLVMTGMIASAWIAYTAEQSGLRLEEFAPYLAVTSVVAIVGFFYLFGRQGAKAQRDSVRLERRLVLLNERLKRIELLRTLDPAAAP
jgi:hypothetical protein